MRAIRSRRAATALLALSLCLVPVLSAQVVSTEPQKTIIKSDRLEATNTGVEGHYVFIGNVRITGTNLEITCDRLEIFSVSTPEANDHATDDAAGNSVFSGAGNIRRMLATGSVTIAQAGRRASCGQAEVLPAEDSIILTDAPVLSDIASGVIMKGTRITYHRGERNAVIENPEVVGPALPNLGFPTDAAEREPATPPPAAPPP